MLLAPISTRFLVPLKQRAPAWVIAEVPPMGVPLQSKLVKSPASAPISVGVNPDRTSLSKSFNTDAIDVPVPSAIEATDGLICKSPVDALPFGLIKTGS